MIKSSLLYILFFLAIAFNFILSWVRGTFMLDPDFGWHLRMGQIILQTGIPATDPFSYTMQSYPFVDHEWLTNIGFSYLHPLIEIPGLAFYLFYNCAFRGLDSN